MFLALLLFTALAAVVAPATPRANPLRPGLHCQVYLDKLPHPDSHELRVQAFEVECRALAANGFVGVAAHGFVGGLTRAKFENYARAAQRAGLQCSAAFGLGQFNSHNPRAAGEWIARVALSPLCAAVLIDAEGAWEDEPSDRPAATTMGEAFRTLAPNAFVVDQPWPVPTLHGSFPDREFAAWIDASARQYYFNDWHDKGRVPRLLGWFSGSVATLLRRLGGLARPQLWTIQGYGWSDVLPDCVDVLVRHQSEPMFVWSEPQPTPEFIRCSRAVQALAARGFTGPGAVREFQRAAGLTADDRCGPLTLAALERPALAP